MLRLVPPDQPVVRRSTRASQARSAANAGGRGRVGKVAEQQLGGVPDIRVPRAGGTGRP